MDDFRLRVFLAMAQEKSFTKAAMLLGVSQPTVSNNVSELEKELGVKLFERLHGETLLTPEGQVFMKYAHRFMSLSSEISDLFTELPQSQVRISVSEEIYTYILSKTLEDFSTVHPQITFERSIFDDADLKFILRPASGTPFDVDPEVIARVKVSLSAPVAGTTPVASTAPAVSTAPAASVRDIFATREINSYFELVCQPTPAFACTKLYRMLRSHLTATLFSVTA